MHTDVKTRTMNSLEDLFMEELRDLYDAEHQLIQALPRLEQAAHADDLKRGFHEHLEQTQRQVQRLEQVFEDRNESPSRKRCTGMQGIIQEAEQLMMEMDIDPDVLDAGLIASAQKAEHYEIASYGTLRTYAQQLGFDQAARLLDHTLKEEAKTDERLTSMAVGHINLEARG